MEEAIELDVKRNKDSKKKCGSSFGGSFQQRKNGRVNKGKGRTLRCVFFFFFLSAFSPRKTHGHDKIRYGRVGEMKRTQCFVLRSLVLPLIAGRREGGREGEERALTMLSGSFFWLVGWGCVCLCIHASVWADRVFRNGRKKGEGPKDRVKRMR